MRFSAWRLNVCWTKPAELQKVLVYGISIFAFVFYRRVFAVKLINALRIRRSARIVYAISSFKHLLLRIF